MSASSPATRKLRGAIVVWQDTADGSLHQAVRQPGASGLDPPVLVVDPRPDQRKNTPVMVGKGGVHR